MCTRCLEAQTLVPLAQLKLLSKYVDIIMEKEKGGMSGREKEEKKKK